MNKSEELAKLLGIEPKFCCWGKTSSSCSRRQKGLNPYCDRPKCYCFPDFTKPSNLYKLKNIFKEWSSPFSFIETGKYKDFYWAHRSPENYIEFLSYSLPSVMPNCLKKSISQAQQTEWEY